MSEPFIGEIRMVGFNYAPRGWAFCQGQLMSIAQNSALFSLLGVTYGGDGRTTFGLPDLRGRSPVGMGAGLGLTNITQGEMSGTESVTILSTQMPAHVHTASQLHASVAIPVNVADAATKTPSTADVLAQTRDTVAGAEVDIYSPDPATTTLKPFNAPVTGQTDITGGGQAVPIRNPFLGNNFIIALEGIFPSRS